MRKYDAGTPSPSPDAYLRGDRTVSSHHQLIFVGLLSAISRRQHLRELRLDAAGKFSDVGQEARSTSMRRLFSYEEEILATRQFGLACLIHHGGDGNR